MNSQRLTLLTIIIAVLVVLAAVIVPRLTSTKGPETVASIDYSVQPRLGNPDAPVKVAVFLDFICPHCASFSENEAPTLVREFVDTGKASLYYLNFPVIDPAVRSRYLAELAECVYQQSNDAFFKLEPIWMRAQNELARDTSRALDLARVDEAIARQANVTGTPSVLIDGVLLANPSIANIRSAIEAAAK